jgi:hypothetical protein
MEQVGVAPPPVPQDRRVALLEEFDRTYSEVQTMLEERIGVVDVALNENPRGLQGAVERAAQPGASEEEIRVLSDYLHRLRDHLGQMLTICDEFLGHIETMGRKGQEPRA